MTPVGWPADVVDPDHPDFVTQVVAWMLDLGPAEWRRDRVWREFPTALAHRLSHDLRARREGARQAYATARVSLAGHEVDIDSVLQALESEGAYVTARIREVELVTEALHGRRWQARL